ncbi:formyltransferase family protein [Streptomyces roseoverticillatus]|uniref:formyltransferase family protein n=1 Tax=Streptomyces roseoverticillatus TaxID=66429 RepID=UPI0006933AE8|nr:formyltransferase family protein [Streptomyces roseoverticillatus]
MTLQVAFFVGSDVTSHLAVNAAVRSLATEDVGIHLFHTVQKPNPAAPRERRDLFFVEHQLTNDVLYPHLDAAAVAEGPYYTPDALARMDPKRITVQRLDNVNSPDTIQELRRRGITLGFSVRCYQKFGADIIQYFSAAAGHSALLNLHPGVLPAYRGVLTYARAMANSDAHAGFTLHHINADWDAGDVLACTTQPLDHDRSVLENMIRHHRAGAALIHEAVVQTLGGERLLSVPQPAAEARYYTHATPEEMTVIQDKGIRLFRAEPVIGTLVRAFCADGGSAARAAHKVLRDAVVGAGILP